MRLRFIFEVFYNAIAHNAIIQSAIALFLRFFAKRSLLFHNRRSL
ncbi:hypothetical protein [Nostoc sp.]